jgi:protease I
MPGIGHAKIMILATNGFEQSELEVPLKTLAAAGAAVDVVSRSKARSPAGTRRTGARP